MPFEVLRSHHNCGGVGFTGCSWGEAAVRLVQSASAAPHRARVPPQADPSVAPPQIARLLFDP